MESLGGPHISHRFQHELERVRQQVLQMGGLVESQLGDALEAFRRGDAAAADRVTERDSEVDALELEIDEFCIRILARRQPAATDLRLVIAMFKTITDLERIGDEAERIAKMAKVLDGETFEDALMSEFGHMGELVERMLRASLDAFARFDIHGAADVLQYDREIDAKYASLMHQVIATMATTPPDIPALLNLLWSARALERIGDRCKNVAEYLFYLIKGKDVRHTSLDAKLKELDH